MANDRDLGWLWFLAGLAAGSSVALLMAPRSGRDTREEIIRKGVEGAESIVGRERIEKGRRMYQRGTEARDLARDTVDVIRRSRKLNRPLDADD